jgi:hypothetical protein
MTSVVFGLLAKTSTSTSGEDAAFYVVALIFAVLFAFIGARMAQKRFRPPWVGGLLGFLLGIFGLIIVAIMGAKSGPPCIACGAPLQMVAGRSLGDRPFPARVCLVCGAQQMAAAGWSPLGPQGATPMPPPPPTPVG